jgi:hypothetical protein
VDQYAKDVARDSSDTHGETKTKKWEAYKKDKQITPKLSPQMSG